ncbi:hypothetical protein [Streptomyces sp. AcE210]|uniref:hypothetical protein n=1 Tax=Streptomyces sp. AcE210 TaxID=2292703 RepID=UPI000E306036|nr:hypothetical protein [Streptomyces sp. AcE210]RFC77352.1 hypothetical protein DXZ75_05160 [Streptomyces sp. AcE210]
MHGVLVTDVEGERVVEIAHGQVGSAAPVDARLVQQDVEDLGAEGAGEVDVVRCVMEFALQVSAVAGERPVPAFLGLVREPRCGHVRGGRAGQAQHLLDGAVQADAWWLTPPSGHPQAALVRLLQARLQGELQFGQRGAQLVGGVGGEVALVAQELGQVNLSPKPASDPSA